jgi:hypothetical protein
MGGMFAVSQVAIDRVRLPEHEISIANHGHHRVRIERQELGRVGRPESRTPVFTREQDFQFGARPENLAYVD